MGGAKHCCEILEAPRVLLFDQLHVLDIKRILQIPRTLNDDSFFEADRPGGALSCVRGRYCERRPSPLPCRPEGRHGNSEHRLQSRPDWEP